MQNLSRPNPVQSTKKTLQIIIIIPHQTMVLPSSRQDQRRYAHEPVPVYNRTDRRPLVVRTATTRPSHQLKLVLAVSFRNDLSIKMRPRGRGYLLLQLL